MIHTRSTYKSNVTETRKQFDRRMERAVSKAAKDGARWASSRSGGSVRMAPAAAENMGGHVTARVSASPADFFAVMLDKGTLSKRKIPLKYPGKRKRTWKSKRTRTHAGTPGVARSGSTKTRTFTAHRHEEAITSGGARPRYFMVRGKRYGEQKLAGYLKA